jgi:hypothetical protein
MPDESDLLPIDVLYGCYDPTTRSIKIFIKRIEQDANLFGAEPSELCEIVRLHEHTHTIVHLGSRVDDVDRDLRRLGPDHGTDWPTLLRERTSRFSALGEDTNEFLAQGLTYAALHKLSGRSERVLEIFDRLETKQPVRYKLPPDVKEAAAKAPWSLVLDAARGAFDNIPREDFSLREALTVLVTS